MTTPPQSGDSDLELRSYQREGAAFLANSESALLADEMGLGKTVQVCAALRALNLETRLARALIVVPASLQLNWVREIERWAPELVVRPVIGDQEDREAYYVLPIRVLVATYEQVQRDTLFLIDSVVAFTVVVLDEAQRIKNSSTSTSYACRMIKRERAWALSGTPLENRPDDLVAIFRFLRPGLLNSMMSRSTIHALIRPHFLRRTKTEVLPELPPIIKQELQLTLTGPQRVAYEELWNSRSKLVGSGQMSAANMLAVLTRLKQLCNYDEETGASAKLEAVESILDSLSEPTDKILIFSQYVETLRWLSAHIELPHELYFGNLTQQEREAVIRRFRERPGPRGLLISLRAGGVGLNLQEASTVVMFDRWWNPAVEDQAIQRAHRLGRSRVLHVFSFVVTDTVEERIAEILEEKRSLFEVYIDEAMTAVPDTSWELEAEDLRQILRV